METFHRTYKHVSQFENSIMKNNESPCYRGYLQTCGDINGQN